MDKRNEPSHSELWEKIYSIVSLIPRKDVDGVDAISATTAVEEMIRPFLLKGQYLQPTSGHATPIKTEPNTVDHPFYKEAIELARRYIPYNALAKEYILERLQQKQPAEPNTVTESDIDDYLQRYIKLPPHPKEECETTERSIERLEEEPTAEDRKTKMKLIKDRPVEDPNNPQWDNDW